MTTTACTVYILTKKFTKTESLKVLEGCDIGVEGSQWLKYLLTANAGSFAGSRAKEPAVNAMGTCWAAASPSALRVSFICVLDFI